jgi:hypothetical protein
MSEAVIGLIGVMVGALITGASEFWKERRTRKKNAEYLAIRIVSLLDRYVEGCTEVAGDDGLCQGQPDEDGCRRIQVEVPELHIQLIDVDWRSIPATLMYQILSFPNKIDAANHRIHGEFEHASSPPDYEEGFEERRYQYALLGLAWQLRAWPMNFEQGMESRQGIMVIGIQ